MNVWRCELYADRALTIPCVTFVGRGTTLSDVEHTLHRELKLVQVRLHPGPFVAVSDEGLHFDEHEDSRMLPCEDDA